jgi:hypothetical protein
MNLIRRAKNEVVQAWRRSQISWKLSVKILEDQQRKEIYAEESLCMLPPEGELWLYDEEEKAAVAVGERAAMDDFVQQCLETGMEPNQILQDPEKCQILGGLMRMSEKREMFELAMDRFADGHIVPAAETCLKALGIAMPKGSMPAPGVEAYLWLLLAHIHAYAGRFRIAADLLRSARKATAKVENQDTADLEESAATIEWHIKGKTLPPLPDLRAPTVEYQDAWD